MKPFSAQHRTQTLSGYETTGNPVVVRTQKERPILFSGQMVRAILECRKSQTRRVMKPQPEPNTTTRGNWTHSPFGRKGDRLWVKETFYDSSRDDKHHPWTYRADCPIEEDLNRDFVWKPSIFMPRRASRIRLEITEVRVERLHDITEEDAMAEGVDRRDYAGLASNTAKKIFAQVWDSINSKTFPWLSNPYCWVIRFKRII